MWYQFNRHETTIVSFSCQQSKANILKFWNSEYGRTWIAASGTTDGGASEVKRTSYLALKHPVYSGWQVKNFLKNKLIFEFHVVFIKNFSGASLICTSDMKRPGNKAT
jgi:hypothetical protein